MNDTASSLTSQGPDTAIRKPSPYDDALQILREELTELENLVASLRLRLTPVLGEEGPDGTPDVDFPETSRSLVVEDLSGLRVRVRRLDEQVRSIVQRLEV